MEERCEPKGQVEAMKVNTPSWKVRRENGLAFPEGIKLALKMKWPNYVYRFYSDGRVLAIWDKDWACEIDRERMKEVVNFISEYLLQT